MGVKKKFTQINWFWPKLIKKIQFSANSEIKQEIALHFFCRMWKKLMRSFGHVEESTPTPINYLTIGWAVWQHSCPLLIFERYIYFSVKELKHLKIERKLKQPLVTVRTEVVTKASYLIHYLRCKSMGTGRIWNRTRRYDSFWKNMILYWENMCTNYRLDQDFKLVRAGI